MFILESPTEITQSWGRGEILDNSETAGGRLKNKENRERKNPDVDS